MNFWWRLRWLLGLWMLLGAIPFVPTSYFAYAKQNKLSIADDNSRKHAIAYDGPSAFAINEKRNGMVAGRDLLSKFAELFAVKSGQATCNDFQAATRWHLGGQQRRRKDLISQVANAKNSFWICVTI